MARLVPLALRAVAAGLGLIVSGSAALRAQTAPATNPPPVKSPPKVVTAGPVTNAAPLPPAMQNTIGRYGNIVTPGDQVAYPLKLRLPFPSEAEVRVPKPDDLVRRQKLEELARLSDDDIGKQLAAWPAYGKMSLRDQGTMLQRIQDFRDYHAKIAAQKAHEMGLLTLTPAQMAKFEKEYWDKRLKVDQDLVKQFQPIYQAHMQKMNDELFRDFSSNMASPAAPKPAAPKPPQPPAKPIAASSPTNAMPIAQAPH